MTDEMTAAQFVTWLVVQLVVLALGWLVLSLRARRHRREREELTRLEHRDIGVSPEGAGVGVGGEGRPSVGRDGFFQGRQ